ncbi:hypothetical protein OESDEN_05428 [Oesophagostomum dentatum]|uniref:DUF4440 domain-containing protein n=1 Tax=Oesophagostomum dentatum TaxID=61180 RepID=A0A0B1TBM4_OESDE|nr:hypothetical protein OESDEN_05428 [Oesophagostomum dentatum]
MRWKKVIEYYHPDAVLIETGKKGIYGKEAIKIAILEFSGLMGKTQMKVTEEHYQKSPDFTIINGSYETTTEKAGVVKGTFLQIWRKTGDKYLLLRDEYTVA